jgi:hypothetical protein
MQRTEGQKRSSAAGDDKGPAKEWTETGGGSSPPPSRYSSLLSQTRRGRLSRLPYPQSLQRQLYTRDTQETDTSLVRALAIVEITSSPH